MFQAIFQRRFRSRSLRLSFHKDFQKSKVAFGLQTGQWDLTRVRKAELIENLPEPDGVQMYCGFGFCILLILRISLALISLKTELTIEGIQCEVSAAIKSEINRDGWWRLFGNFGDGLKEEIEGIQEVVQIGKCEVVDTWRQAWAWSSGLLCKIPFPNHRSIWNCRCRDEITIPNIFFSKMPNPKTIHNRANLPSKFSNEGKICLLHKTKP